MILYMFCVFIESSSGERRFEVVTCIPSIRISTLSAECTHADTKRRAPLKATEAARGLAPQAQYSALDTVASGQMLQ